MKGNGNMKKTLSLLSVLLISLLFFFGCAKQEGGRSETDVLTSSVTVRNASDEDVVIKSAPKRVIALPLWEAEMIIDLIDADRIVGLSPLIDNPANTSCTEKASRISGRVTSSEAEKILGLQPDLVLLDTFNDFDGSLTATLKGAGITVLTLASPVTFEQIGDRLDTVSRALFVPEKGRQLIDDMNQRLVAVNQKVGGVSEKIRIMFYDDYYGTDGKSNGMLSAYGKGSPFEAIAQAAGAVNVCTAADYSAVSKETVLNDWKPELLVVPGIRYDESFNAVNDNGASKIAAIKSDAILKTLPAVKNSRLVALQPEYGGSTSHYMTYAVEELAKFCYPDLF